MRTTRYGRQDGFFREIFWLAVVVVVIALVLLDSLSLYNARQSAYNSATAGARAALLEYAQSSSVTEAESAAQTSVDKSGNKWVAFHTTSAFDGTTAFMVTARSHANTYAFHYLSYIPGLKKWVHKLTNPVGTETSD